MQTDERYLTENAYLRNRQKKVVFKIASIMSTITKIKDFYAEKLNNYEYAYFTTEFLALVKAITAGKLHVTQNVVDRYETDATTLIDLTQKSRISDETAKIADIDKQTDDLIIYIFDSIRSNKKSPLAARKTAATELYNALKPYVGCYRLAQRQEVQAVRGMLADLAKEKLAAHVATLRMEDMVEALTESVNEYAALLTQREEGKADNNVVNTKQLRASLVEQYDYISTMAFVYSVAEPSEELTNFVQKTNILIDSVNQAYNLRTGNKGKKEDPTVTAPNNPDEEPVTPEITKFYPKENANPDKPLEFPRNKTAVLEGKGLKLVDSPEGKKAQLVLINYVEQRMPHEDSAILLNTDEKIEFTMMYDAAEGQYNFQIETYPNGTEEVVIIKYPETITLI